MAHTQICFQLQETVITGEVEARIAVHGFQLGSYLTESTATITYKAAQSRGLILGPVFKNASCTMRLTSILLFVFALSLETSSGLIALIRFRGGMRSPADRLNVLAGDSAAPGTNEVAFMRLES